MKIKLNNALFYLVKKLQIIMLRTFIFLICATVFGFTSGDVLSQNAKIKIDYDQSMTVDEVFNLIMHQTDYTFIYQVDMFKDYPKVELKKGIIKANTLLEKSLASGPYSFVFTDSNTIIIEGPSSSAEQQKTITGNVKDESGNPLPGVNVTVENTDNGTQTDFDGNYKITVGVNDKALIFSYIGMETQKVLIEKKTSINVVLKEFFNTLDEVVITSYQTGYQTVSKERATGAFNVVSPVQIKNNVNQNIGSTLQGVVAGVAVVEDADGNIDARQVIMRGIGSFNSPAYPLVVVDGFPVEGGFNTINPNDVESITILKDAAAASIWGARAGNGVIVVVTKKSKNKEGLQIELSSYLKMRPKIDLDANITTADTQTTLAFENTMFVPGGQGSTLSNTFMGGSRPPVTLADRDIVSRSWTFGTRAQYDLFNGNITQAEFNNIRQRLSGINKFDDINKYFLVSPLEKQYNLSFGTNGERSNTRFSAVFNDNQNAFVKDTKNQLLLNFANNYKIRDWVSFNFATMLENSANKNSGIYFSTIQNMSPYENLIEPNGSYSNVRGSYDPTYLKYFQNTIKNLMYDDITFNPLRDARENEFSSKRVNYRVSTGLSIEILKGLVFKPSFQYEKFNSEYKNYWGENSSTVKWSVVNGTEWRKYYSTDPNYLYYDPATAMLGERRLIPKGAQFQSETYEEITKTIRNLLTYDKSFGEKHDLNFLAGFESKAYTNKGIRAARTYGFNKANNTFVVPVNYYWYGLWGGGSVADGRNYSQRDSRFLSYFGNIAYTFNKKYTISGSARSDGANFIVKEKSQRYDPMWSAGLSWNAKKEAFLQNVNFINALKFRITNGEAGNLVGSSSTVPTISLGTTPDQYYGWWASLSSIGNPDLHWERVNTLNGGVDFDLFNRKLYGSIDLYNKLSTDLIASVDISPTLGSTSATFNVGSMRNKGIELNLSSDLNISDNFKLTTNLVGSYNKSEVISLKDVAIHPRSLPSFPYIEGKPAYPVYAWVYNGMQTLPGVTGPYPTIMGENDKLYGMNENIGQNGEDGRDVLRYMGTRVAPTIIGWNNTFTFKSFTLSARITGKFGHVFRRPSYSYNPSLQGGGYHKDLKDLLAGKHDEMGLPALPIQYEFYQYRWSWYAPDLNTLVENANHIRFRQLYMAYDMPSSTLSSLGLSKVRISLQAENLGLIWKANKYNIDPEYINGVTRAPEKAFSFGVNFEF